ncbi:TolC family outer membrane protein [Bauldia litoralis]|uniref:TolC family outer membrane protein n=1 Tax=Bauldia litoralis TaxID=665467 RepID=UPI003D65A711
MFVGRGVWAATVFLVAASVCGAPASAESLDSAMASAYTNNPDLNSARAQLRAIDEGVPRAKSSYRPQISLSGDIGASTSRSKLFPEWSTGSTPRGVTLAVEQPLFLGFRTKNSVKMAETSVKAAREQLKLVEQQVLFDAVSAFMDVVRAQVVVNLTAQNVEFLREQVRAAKDRLEVGEGTRTDVAQTDARLSQGMSDYASAVSDLNRSIAVYVQVIGHKPERLGAVNGIEKLIPASVDAGLATAQASHPGIIAGLYNIDVASWNVRISEGATLPTVTLSGSVTHRDNGVDGIGSSWNDTAAITGRLNVPIYQGGEVAADVRQLKETLGQRRIELDSTRAEVRQRLISTWGALDAAKAVVRSAALQVSAQQLVLSGVIEERRVGQRTTLDVLNAQQDLLAAQVEQVTAQRDRVVAAYALVAALGKLNAQSLGLPVTVYDPDQHYDAVKDKWMGLRTPDGR